MLYIVAGLFVVLLVLCFMSLVSFTGFYTEGEPKFWRGTNISSNICSSLCRCGLPFVSEFILFILLLL